MLDLETLKTINEALDIVLDNLVEKNALKNDSPYAQSFIKAQKKVCQEITQRTAHIIQAKKTAKIQR